MRGINLRFSNANALSSLTAQAGACSSSAYAAISKIIALQAIFAFMSFCLKKISFVPCVLFALLFLRPLKQLKLHPTTLLAT